jgi:hypothetical protein
MMLSGFSSITGLQFYEVYTNEMGMAISLGLVAYSLLCIGYAYKVVFYVGGDDDG